MTVAPSIQQGPELELYLESLVKRSHIEAKHTDNNPEPLRTSSVVRLSQLATVQFFSCSSSFSEPVLSTHLGQMSRDYNIPGLANRVGGETAQ